MSVGEERSFSIFLLPRKQPQNYIGLKVTDQTKATRKPANSNRMQIESRVVSLRLSDSACEMARGLRNLAERASTVYREKVKDTCGRDHTGGRGEDLKRVTRKKKLM